jgi:hypothetical protein
MHILIVEDDRYCTIFTAGFRRDQVTSAFDGLQGFELQKSIILI